MSVAASFYRPMFMVWMNVNYWMFGDRPWGWHLTTVLAHLAATVLAFFLAKRLTKNAVPGLIAALIFGLHPVHIEAVAWIAGVTESLMFVFLAGGWLCELKPEESHSRWGWLAFGILLYAIAVLVKETAVLLPALIFIYRFGRDKSLKTAFLRALPFGVVALAYLAVRFAVLHQFAEVVQPLSPKQVVLTAPPLLWFYLSHLLVPTNLSGFYDIGIVQGFTVGSLLLPLAALGVIGFLTIYAYRGLRDSRNENGPAVLASFALILLPLLPALNLRVLQPYNFAHDRYLYLPSLGLAILVGIALAHVASHQIQWVGVAGLGILLVVGVVAQEKIWHDDAALFLDGMKNAPGNPIPATNLAAILISLQRYPEAVTILERTAARTPDFWPIYADLADAYAGLGQSQKAEHYYLETYKRYPDVRYLGRAQMMHRLAQDRAN
jgi:hypothetical protein